MSEANKPDISELFEASLAKIEITEATSYIRGLLTAGDLSQRSTVMQIADFYYNRLEYELALKWYSRVSDLIEPGYPCAYSNQANCLYRTAGTSKALSLLNHSLSRINFSLSAYTLEELFSYLKVYCLLLLKSNRHGSIHPIFFILSELLKMSEVDELKNIELVEQCRALNNLKESEPNPIPKNSAAKLKEKIEVYASVPSGLGKLVLSRPGNIEVVACLCGKYTWALGNNAGIYFSKNRELNCDSESFLYWKKLYIEAMSLSDHVMIANLFDNYAGPFVSTLGLKDRVVDYPEFEFWTEALSTLLETKVVLCISPFAKSMKDQSRYLQKIHGDKLPFNVENLRFYKCVQSIAYSSDSSWISNYETMRGEISDVEFDIALISAGGYGHPLVAHLANQGKSAIYCGGLLQIIFGITGRRFDSYSVIPQNGYWRRPSWDETPVGFLEVEGGCYW